MSESLDRAEQVRYVRALHFAVVDQRAEFQPGEVFAGWFARHGHLFHASIEDAWLNRYAAGFPHRPENGGEQ
jgi:hypothetical protein